MTATAQTRAAIVAAVESLNAADARPLYSELQVIAYRYVTFFTTADVMAIKIAHSEDNLVPGGQGIAAPTIAVQVAAQVAFEVARQIAAEIDDAGEIEAAIDDLGAQMAVRFDFATDDGAILFFPDIPAREQP